MNKKFITLVIACFLSGITMPRVVLAQDHVLIMTISDYRENPLLGVKHDAENALALVRHLGYDTTRAVILKDKELAGQGIVQALSRMETDLRDGDRVFVYYSGHGTSVLEQGVCEQALVSQDMQRIRMDALHRWTESIRSRTLDVVFLVDACYAGGLGNLVVTSASRSAKGSSAQAWSEKLWQPKGSEACHVPVNRAREWKKGFTPRGMLWPEARVTVIAAANEREVALDDPATGGLATSALLACAKGGIKDMDGSGAVNFAELKTCAQQKLNTMVAYDGKGFTAHNIQVFGNDELVLPAEIMDSVRPTVSDAEAVEAAFRQLEANSDAGWGLSVDVKTPVVKLGEKGIVDFSLTRPGYVYLLYVGSSRTHMKQMFPAAGDNVQAQDERFNIDISAPVGDNRFLLIATEQPYDFSEVFKKNGQERISTKSLRSLQRTALYRDASAVTMGKKTVVDGRPKMVARTFVIKGE